MLHEFLLLHSTELIARCRAKVAQRPSPQTTELEGELGKGVPLFFDQLIKTLEIEQGAQPLQSRQVSGPAGGGNLAVSEIGDAAAQHGRELLRRGFTVEQVVHGYGDICQAVTDLAVELGSPFSADEFRTLNRCLDNAVASAVTEFNYQHNFVVTKLHSQELNERLGFLAHELRNYLSSAVFALAIIKDGHVGLAGATMGVLERSLSGMSKLIDRSLAEVRMTAGLPQNHQLFPLADFILEVKVSFMIEVRDRDCTLTVSTVDPLLAVMADRDLLFSAVSNLLLNAFKFTQPNSNVTLSAYASADRILIDIEDHCGGLPQGFAETMFQPFTQGSEDRSGLGLGLSIARRSVEANQGTLRVHDIPGSGCIFTIDLQRYTLLEH